MLRLPSKSATSLQEGIRIGKTLAQKGSGGRIRSAATPPVFAGTGADATFVAAGSFKGGKGRSDGKEITGRISL
jgi:hypothetical protein